MEILGLCKERKPKRPNPERSLGTEVDSVVSVSVLYRDPCRGTLISLKQNKILYRETENAIKARTEMLF